MSGEATPTSPGDSRRVGSIPVGHAVASGTLARAADGWLGARMPSSLNGAGVRKRGRPRKGEAL